MLSKKETIAVLLLVTALICVLNATLFGAIMPISASYQQMAQQVISVSTAYLCILHGLSTWLYHSNYAEPRRHIRYVLIAVLVIMIAANIIGLYTVIREHFISQLNDAINIQDIHSSFGYACRFITLVLFVITIVLLLTTLFIVVRTALRRHKHANGLRAKEELP